MRPEFESNRTRSLSCARPKLIFLQPFDYWHVVPEAPAGYWVEHFDVVFIREAKEAGCPGFRSGSVYDSTAA